MPVPPPDVIACGTRGVFAFLQPILRGDAIWLRGKVFASDCDTIDLSSENIGEEELMPLLASFKLGKFSRLRTLNLVNFVVLTGCLPLAVTY